MKLTINEKYRAIQGEGPDIGKACFFIRTQHCPVHCKFCDSFFTWDGSEKGDTTAVDDLQTWLDAEWQKFPGCGVVLTGGEPLLHFRNQQLGSLMYWYRSRSWSAIETSGFVGPKKMGIGELESFLVNFSTISLSPKITPCFRGEWTDAEMLTNVPLILDFFKHSNRSPKSQFCLKFVVKEQQDIDVVKQFRDDYQPSCPIYLMPLGIETAEVAESCRNLEGVCAKEGFILSPRLHVLLYGPKRAV